MEASIQKHVWYKPWTWKWSVAFEIAREYAETSLVLLFIVNGLATFLILAGLTPSASEAVKHLVGSISFGFSIVALVKFTNHGVKHQLKSNSKKGAR